MTPRSWLFVPGDSQRKLDKSASCGSDALIIDLEDSVAESAKDAAREMTGEFVRRSQAHPSALWVRVNRLSSGLTRRDIHAVVGPNLAGIVLPKCEGSSDIVAVANLLAAAEAQVGAKRGSIEILPLVTETPKSLFRMQTYALATARLAGLSWGAEDLSAAVGAISARDDAGQLTAPYQLARSLCLFAASAAGVVAVETVYPAFSDDKGLTTFAAAARRDGFVGMMAIHPGQVPIVNAAFTPTDEEVAFAKEIIAEFEAAPERGTVALRGKMIDRPHLTQAKRLLERSASAASRAS